MKKSPYTRAETWAIRPDNHNLGDRGSDADHFSKSVRSGAPPVISGNVKDKPASYFVVKVARQEPHSELHGN